MASLAALAPVDPFAGASMKPEALRALLTAVADGELAIDAAAERLAQVPRQDIDYAELDLHRTIRTGHPEVVFGSGKSASQIATILRHLREGGQIALATRVDTPKARQVVAELPEVVWHELAGVLVLGELPPATRGHIAVICAGTSDLAVAEEAAVVAEALGNRVTRYRDIGVAGLHRTLSKLEGLREAKVLIVVAGMEGALPSVIAGLVQRPVIAVPTSVGYGAAFGGLAALLGMLNSCSPGISVVNIDNGFGAAMQASQINRLATEQH